MDSKQDISRKSVNIFHILKNTVVHHCDLQSILYFKLFLKLLNICAISVLCYINTCSKATNLGTSYVAALVVSIANITNMFLVGKDFSNNFKVNFDKYGFIFCSLAESLKVEIIPERRKQIEADDGISIPDKIHMKEQLRFLKDVICLTTLDAMILLVNIVCLMKDKDWSYVFSYKVEMYSVYTIIAILTVECIYMILRDPFLEEITGLKKLLKEVEEMDALRDNSTNVITEDVVQIESAVNEVEISDSGILNDSGFDENVKDQKEIPFREMDPQDKYNVEDNSTVELNEKETLRECSIKETMPEETTENENHTEKRSDSSIKSDNKKNVGKKNRKRKNNNKNKCETKMQKSDNLTTKESKQEKCGVSTKSILDTKKAKNLVKPSTRCKTREDNNKIHDPEHHYSSNTGEDLDKRVEDSSNTKNVEETKNSVDSPSSDLAVNNKSRRKAEHGPEICSNTDENMKQTEMLEGSSKKQSMEKNDSSEELTLGDIAREDQPSKGTVNSSPENCSEKEEYKKQETDTGNSSEKQNYENTKSSTELASNDKAEEDQPSKGTVNSPENCSDKEECKKQETVTGNSSEKQNYENTKSSTELTSSDKAECYSKPSEGTVNSPENCSEKEEYKKHESVTGNSSEKQNYENTKSSTELTSSDKAEEDQPSKGTVNSPENCSDKEEYKKQETVTSNSSEKQNYENTKSSTELTSNDKVEEDQPSKDTENIPANSSDNDEYMKKEAIPHNSLKKQNYEKTKSSAELTSSKKTGEDQPSVIEVDSSDIYLNTEKDIKKTEQLDSSSGSKNILETDSCTELASSGIAGEDKSSKNTVKSSENYSDKEEYKKQETITDNSSKKQNYENTKSSAERTSSYKAGEDQPSITEVDSSDIYSNSEKDIKKAEKIDSSSGKQNVLNTDSSTELASNGIADEKQSCKSTVNSPESYSNTEDNMKQPEISDHYLEKQNKEEINSSADLISSDIAEEDQPSKKAVNSPENFTDKEEYMMRETIIDNSSKKENYENAKSLAEQTSSDKSGEGQPSINEEDSSDIYSNTEKAIKKAEKLVSSSEMKNVLKTDNCTELASSGIAGEDKPRKNTLNSLEKYSNSEKDMKQAKITDVYSEKENVEKNDSLSELTSSDKAEEDQLSRNAVESTEVYLSTYEGMNHTEGIQSGSETKNFEKTDLGDPTSSNKETNEDFIRSKAFRCVSCGKTEGFMQATDDEIMEKKMIKSCLHTGNNENNYSKSRVEFTHGTFNLSFNYSEDNNLSLIYMKNPKGSRGVIADYYCKYDLSPRKNT